MLGTCERQLTTSNRTNNRETINVGPQKRTMKESFQNQNYHIGGPQLEGPQNKPIKEPLLDKRLSYYYYSFVHLCEMQCMKM